MWTLFRVVPNKIMADAWEDLLEAEGIPVLVQPDEPSLASAHRLYVPEAKLHVVNEILRKI